jgi:uncharacterized protein YciI
MPLFVLILLLDAQTPAAAPPVQLSQMQMVFFKPGPTPPDADAMPRMQGAHLALLGRLNRERINLLYGPFRDSGDLRGIAIVDVPDAAAATRLFADDPFVKGGHMVLEVTPWYGVKTEFHLPDEPLTPENLVLGFLMRGSNTTQPDAEAQAIQKGHLAYMDSLHKQGKLLVAGPFGDGGARRGIVIYRVATLEEARQLAAGDPAVKAGRLVIDARPWLTFKGILK